MNSTITDKENSQKEVSISIPWSIWEKDVDAAIDHLRAHVKVDGFRDGKIPRDIVIREVGNEAVIAEATDRAVKKAYIETIKDEKISVIGQPDIRVMKVAEGNPLEFVAIVTVLPSIEMKKGWRKDVIAENKKNVDKKDNLVEDKDIDAELEKIAKSRAKNTEVDRGAKKDDVAIITFSVEVGGVVIDGGTGKDHPLVLGSGTFIPGFEDAVVGMKAGEEKVIALSFPKEYHASQYAGKEAEFTVLLQRVEEQIIPEVDDDFAKSLGSQFKSLDDLKGSIRIGMAEEKKKEVQTLQRDAIADILVKYVSVDLPEQMITDELGRMEDQFSQQLAGSNMTIEAMLEKMNQSKEDLLKEWRPQAEKRSKIGLALDEIADAYNVEATQEDVEAEMNRTIQMYGGKDEIEKKVDLAHLYEYTKASLRQNEVFTYLEGLK